MTESQLCPICKNPRRSSSYGSLTQWIVACNCDLGEVEAAEELDEAPSSLSMCRDCGKRIGEGRAGSFTQFIFRSDVCRCNVPKPLRDALDAAPIAQVQIVVDEVEEVVLTFGDTAFPIDRYRPLAELGSGAGGAVYLARDLMLNKKVAVKMLHMLEAKQLVAFQDEARANSRLNHPNIVGVNDFGLTGDGVPYMVLEYFQGMSLEKVLDRQGSLDWSAAQFLFAQTCDALHYAHQNGVFHRDIKPSNMLLMDNDNGGVDVRLIDFGIAKIATSNKEGISTQEQPLVGAPIYMSPDQGLGLPYDSRSEVYSLGCVIFECVTGRPPFEGETAFQTLNMHAQQAPPRLVDVKPDGDFPSSLEALVAKALSKKPADRFQDMMEFRQAIQDADPASSFRQTSTFLPEHEEKPPQTVTSKIIVALVVCILLVGTIVVAQSMNKPHVPTKEELKKIKEEEREALESKNRMSDINGLKTSVIANELNLTGGKWNREEKEIIEGHEVFDEDFKDIGDCAEARAFKVTLESKVTGSGFKYLQNPKFFSILIMSHLFNDEGAKELAKIKTIHRLCFHYNNKLTAKGIGIMAEGLPELRQVQLRFMVLPKGVVRALQPAKKLDHLDLGHSEPLTPEMIEDIAALKNVSNLTITNTGLDDAGLAVISTMPNLIQVDLNENQITDEGLMTLAKNAKALRGMKVTVAGGITSLGVKRFAKLRPEIKIKIGGDSTRKLMELLD